MSIIILLLRGLFGMAVIVGIAYAFSSNRKAIDWRVVGAGIGLQVIFALIVLKSSFGREVFQAVAYGFAELL
ncbi:MAG: Na+ dependent nucleoside transporter N-terminal domain-containing protein, partial [Rhodothermia bacterium]